jgi:hypothetical protein
LMHQKKLLRAKPLESLKMFLYVAPLSLRSCLRQ